MLRTVRLMLLVAFIAVLACGGALAEKWSFGVMADTQWESTTDPNNPNGVALEIIKQINSQFIEKKVKFVVQVGDLCQNEGKDCIGLQTRLDAAKDLTASGIPFYGLRGNHEGRDAAIPFFQKNFIPRSADEAKVDVAPDGISYAVTYKNIKLILLDIALCGNVDALKAQTAWMDSELKAKDHAQAFVFAHKNLLGQNHKDNLFSKEKVNDGNPDLQNAFIGVLAANKVKMYISGHDHMHNRSIITSPDGKSKIEQLICQSDSYKFYTPQEPFSSRNKQISQELYKVGFYVFKVDGSKVSIDYYSADPACQTNPEEPDEKIINSTPKLTFEKKETWKK